VGGLRRRWRGRLSWRRTLRRIPVFAIFRVERAVSVVSVATARVEQAVAEGGLPDDAALAHARLRAVAASEVCPPPATAKSLPDLPLLPQRRERVRPLPHLRRLPGPGPPSATSSFACACSSGANSSPARSAPKERTRIGRPAPAHPPPPPPSQGSGRRQAGAGVGQARRRPRAPPPSALRPARIWPSPAPPATINCQPTRPVHLR